MRGTLIVALLVVACAITGAAQGTPNGLVLPPGTNVTAQQATSSSKDVVVFSGNVTVAMSGATATADRATFRQSSQTFELEGHVQLKATPPAK
jgi:lipopolysaccharide assembly outer membrane protein LptD (OstA)